MQGHQLGMRRWVVDIFRFALLLIQIIDICVVLLLTLTRYPLFDAEARLTCRAEVSPCESGQGLTTVMT